MDKEPLIDFIKQNIPNITIDENALLSIATNLSPPQISKRVKTNKCEINS